MSLFKRKPGGTFVGNILRKAANSASGGVLGNGAMMISQEEYDLKNLPNDAYMKKYGKTKEGVEVSINLDGTIETVDQRIQRLQREQQEAAKASLKATTIKEAANKYKFPIIAAIVAVVGFIIYKLVKRKK